MRGTITASDERFSGTHYYSWDTDGYTLASRGEGQVALAEGTASKTTKVPGRA